MFGYATDETEELMPLTHVLSTKLIERLSEARNSKELVRLLTVVSSLLIIIAVAPPRRQDAGHR